MTSGAHSSQVLIVRAGRHLCALRLAEVLETWRTGRVDRVPGSDDVVRGVAPVRGRPVPVLSLTALLCADSTGEPHAAGPGSVRLVVLRVGERQVALEVDGIEGIASLGETGLERTPPLLARAPAARLDALRYRDGELMLVLGFARLVPEGVLARIGEIGREDGQ